MHVVHRSRRKPIQGGAVDRADLDRLQLGQRNGADRRLDIGAHDRGISLVRFWCGLRPDVVEPSIEEGRNRELVRLDRAAALQLSDQPGALDLCLPLGAREAVPAALALPGLRVAGVQDDRPAAGRSLADVASHDVFLLRALARF